MITMVQRWSKMEGKSNFQILKCENGAVLKAKDKCQVPIGCMLADDGIDRIKRSHTRDGFRVTFVGHFDSSRRRQEVTDPRHHSFPVLIRTAMSLSRNGSSLTKQRPFWPPCSCI